MTKKNIKNYLSSFSVNHENEEELPDGTPFQSEEYLNTASSPQPETHAGQKPQIKDMEKDKESTIIGQDMVIDGSVSAIHDIYVYGTIQGNVTTNGDLYVVGTVKGDISAKCVDISCKLIEGNVIASEDIVIHSESKVEGFLNTKNVTVRGQLKGNITASGHVSLYESSVVCGDIESKTLEISKGSSFNGKICQKGE